MLNIQKVVIISWKGAYFAQRGVRLKVPSDENTKLKVHPLKPGVGQYIAMHATLTARDFFFASFYTSNPFTCIFPKPLLCFSCVSCGKHWFLCRPAGKKQVVLLYAGSRAESPRNIIIIIINPLTARVVGAPQMILQPVFFLSIFPCASLPSGTRRTPGLSIS